jgi:hypothetical protein
MKKKWKYVSCFFYLTKRFIQQKLMTREIFFGKEIIFMSIFDINYFVFRYKHDVNQLGILRHSKNKIKKMKEEMRIYLKHVD